MSNLFGTLRDFKDFKNGPPKGGILHGSLSGIKKKVIIPVPADSSPTRRWWSLKLLVMIAWSARAAGSIATGALLSILSIFAEQPANMLRSLIDDPDLEAHIIEMTMQNEGDPKFTTRGLDLAEQERRYHDIAYAGPDNTSDPNPFVHAQATAMDIRTTEELQKAISTVTLQIWILLTKAVTAPDTAKESEQRRWIKFLQQKRVDETYRLKSGWLDNIREKISSDISVRRYMVQILITINKSTGTKGRLLEGIADIGNYISETGMASFFLTIKFGIETKYPALALNEFQGDLGTMINLMKLYKEQGDRAPYLVILEDSIQVKFAPGNYPLLWSYAMGVGTAIDKSMGNLNFNRAFLEPTYFRLGQEVVNKLEGNVDSRMAADLGLTQDQIDSLKGIVKDENTNISTAAPRPRVSGFTATGYMPEDEDDEQDHDERIDEGVDGARVVAVSSRDEGASSFGDFHSRLKRVAENLKQGKRQGTIKTKAQVLKAENQDRVGSSDDLNVMNSV